MSKTYKIPKVKWSFYVDYNIIDGKCFVYQETQDDRVHNKFICKTDKSSCDELKEDEKFIYITI